jgi:hypothetical protein
MRTGARVVRSFGVLLMRGSVIRNTECTTNGPKQHYTPCVTDDSAGCVSYANVQPHHQVRSVYIVREVRPHYKTRKEYIGVGRGATTCNKGEGWVGRKHKQPFKVLAYRLRQQSTQTNFEKVMSRSGGPSRDSASALAKAGAKKEAADEIDLDVPATFDIQGVKSSAATQRVMYQGLVEWQEKPARCRLRKS